MLAAPRFIVKQVEILNQSQHIYRTARAILPINFPLMPPAGDSFYRKHTMWAADNEYWALDTGRQALKNQILLLVGNLSEVQPARHCATIKIHY